MASNSTGRLGMPHFRCYCQNRSDQIIARHDIIAPDLIAALRKSRWLCGTNSVEIWEGILRVYPPPYEVRDGAVSEPPA